MEADGKLRGDGMAYLVHDRVGHALVEKRGEQSPVGHSPPSREPIGNGERRGGTPRLLVGERELEPPLVVLAAAETEVIPSNLAAG